MQWGRPSSKQQCRQSLSEMDQLDRTVWTWDMLCTTSPPQTPCLSLWMCLFEKTCMDVVTEHKKLLVHTAVTWLANQCAPSLPSSLYVAGSANLPPLDSFSFSPFVYFACSLSLRRRNGMEVVKGLVGSAGYWSDVSSETVRLGENRRLVWRAQSPPAGASTDSLPSFFPLLLSQFPFLWCISL